MNITVKWFVLLLLSFIANVYAEVIVDGSLGGSNRALRGPVYNINEGLGQRQGANLFHSFSHFNINTGEEARFNVNGLTQNILARVTGGKSSLIDGLISTNSPANLWLMNPAGWVVGKNAQLNVNGAFHLSSAHGIGFAGGEMFFADPMSQSVLSAAAPIDYQFKSGDQAIITLDQADLIMSENQDISVVGGDIHMKNSSIIAPGGRILLASNSGQGQWHFDGTGLTQGNGSGGTINIEHDTASQKTSLSNSDDFSDSATSAGTLQITAHQINLENASIFTNAGDNKNAGDTTLQADQIHFDASFIDNNVLGSKNAGTIEFVANDLIMENGSTIRSDTSSETTGQGGDISVDLKGKLFLSGQSGISSFSQGNNGGDIKLNSDSIVLKDKSFISVATWFDSNAGDLNIATNQLILNNEATLSAATLNGKGNGGKISINAGSISLAQGSDITSSSLVEGNTGTIDIQANNLSLTDSKIWAESEGTGATGTINLDISDTLKVQQDSQINTLALETDGGDIIIKSQGLAVQQSQIVTSVEGSQGNGGDITIDTGTLIMSGGFIQANTAAVGASGGEVQVNATNTLASHGGILSGGDERQQFSPNSNLNVIQAAAPEGVSGQVKLSTVELNIAGQLAKIDSSFVAKKPIANDPCNVARNQKMSSLIRAGHGGLPAKASDSINLPLHHHLSKDKLQPQSQLNSAEQKLAFLSAHDVCQQDRN